MQPNFPPKRVALLIQLESIIGNECFNANIENYGPGGLREAPGRSIRYPLTVRDSDGQKSKLKAVRESIDPQVLMSGYYAFGANQLDVVNALSKIVDFLEKNHGLVVGD